MASLPPEILAATLAADHPKIAALAASIDARAGHGRPVERERALLADLIERSRERRAARLARLPRPDFPEELPIAQHRERIAALIRGHPITIVSGETGSGKTTQIPKICLTLERGAAGLIGCTQPRRIAARSLAHRLAQELPGAPRAFVGHKIRFQDATRPETVLKVMTDGILLAETHSDRELRAYDTIIVDEAHERSLNVDFLLGYMKRLVKIRPELKVIVTSATIDTERFSQFFDGAPVIEVSGRTYPVEVRYRPEFFERESPLDGVAGKAEDDEPVEMAINAARSQVLFRLKTVEVVATLIQGTFPNYSQLIPQSYASRAEIDMKQFLQETRIAAILARAKALDAEGKTPKCTQAVTETKLLLGLE